MIKVRIDNQVIDLPTLKGVDGKSAYQYAVEAGFEGTEQEFINLLIDASNTIYTHMEDTDAHVDIRELINERATIKYVNNAIEAAIDSAIAASY